MTRRLLLIGGGHSHVEVIRRWSLNPERGVDVVLISPDRHTPYSGMLPGFIAGHYQFEDCHIDLDALCHRAGVIRIENALAAIDLTRHAVRCEDGSEHPYDVVSIDTGSTPTLASIPGAGHIGIPVKPVARFLGHWATLREAARAAKRDISVTVVGAGAAGVEVALAMQYRIHADGGRARFTLVSDGPAILASHPAGVQRRFAAILRARGITVRLRAPVQSAEEGGLLLPGGERLPADRIIWVTGAAAPAWPRDCGLQTDAAGFIAVDANLQSLSHPGLFAAGDVATMTGTPHPKSGVYAVRQGPPLAENLRRAARGAPLLRYHPQRIALALISTGDRCAVASYGPLSVWGNWVWRWKDRIDTAFMRRYRVAAQDAAREQQ
ncbi:MAG: FAD-dependent oxidoreductase [Burkholderiales bacterium]